jgi:hypothetical protein
MNEWFGDCQIKRLSFDKFKSQGLHNKELSSKFERLFRSCYIPRPFHPLWFDYSNNIRKGIQIMKFFLPPVPWWFLVWLIFRPWRWTGLYSSETSTSLRAKRHFNPEGQKKLSVSASSLYRRCSPSAGYCAPHRSKYSPANPKCVCSIWGLTAMTMGGKILPFLN